MTPNAPQVHPSKHVAAVQAVAPEFHRPIPLPAPHQQRLPRDLQTGRPALEVHAHR